MGFDLRSRIGLGRSLRRSNILAAAALLFSFYLTQPARAEQKVLHGHVPKLVAAGLKSIGNVDPSKPMEVLIGLPLRNGGALTNLLTSLYDSASDSFHKFLTPEEFSGQFGPTASDYDAVIAFAKSNGLAVAETFANRTLLRVSGTAADMERVFHVNLRQFPHPTENRSFFAPDAEPAVDLNVTLSAITGLDDFIIPRPQSLRPAKHNPAVPLGGSAPGNNYWGDDFRAAYVPGTSLTGAGQKVGIFELDGYYAGDITNYESNISGSPHVPLTNFYVDGSTGGAGSDNLEVSLDIELAIAMAQGLAGVIVYEGQNDNNITAPNAVLNCMATNNAARQLTCSWGFNINSSTDATFQQFAAQGQSFFLASGDSGAFTGAAEPPLDDPYATVVGGTTLTTIGPAGAWVSEKVWNWFTSGAGTNASTGGISTTYPIPTWQSAVSMVYNGGSTNMRNIPDVALTADNIWVIDGNGKSNEVGGTSCAAPLWAGFTALANQQAAANFDSPVGFLNPAIYALGLATNYPATFHDITVGNNTNATVTNKFFAAAGYDLCTGWGTPNGTNLINALAPFATSPIISGMAKLASESCAPTNGAIDPGETVTVNLVLSNSSPAASTNLVATLLSSASVIEPTGAVSVGALVAGSDTFTAPFTFTASGTCGEQIFLVWQLQDGSDNLGNITNAFTLGSIVGATTLAQNFDGVTAPSLPTGWSSVVSDSQTNWITVSGTYDTSPNAAFANDLPNAGVAYLYSPVVPIASTNAQLSFRQNYNTEYGATGAGNKLVYYYYDGGDLQISIGGGSYEDIIGAGGTFVSGGYNSTIYFGYGNPLGNSNAWAGNSGGWITTVIDLPAAAAGQNVQFRWAFGTDNGNSYPCTGWYVDTASLHDESASCCGDTAKLSISQSSSPPQFTAGLTGAYTITVTNAGPDLAADVVITDTLPASVRFVSATSGGYYTNGTVIWPVGAILSGTSASVSVSIVPESAGVLTNTASASTVTPASAIFPALNFTTVNVALSIHSQPTNTETLVGGTALFQVGATGDSPLTYQWYFDATNSIAGATNAQLTLTNVQPPQAGTYSVIVSSGLSSLDSASATLKVLAAPTIPPGGLKVTGGRVSLAVNSYLGLTYMLEYKNYLTDPAWTPLPSSAADGTGGVIPLQDVSGTQSQRFYQIVAY